MNKIIYVFLIVILNTMGVLAIDKKIVLDSEIDNSTSKVYEATKSVSLVDQFSYSSSGNNAFTGRINDYAVDYPKINNSTEAYVGTTEGSLSVSPSGGAIYDIPIKVAPGTAGMEPHISLVYNSQGGNGLLGMGWSISGTSAITRSSTSLYLDNMLDPVDFDDNDVFKLDGNRLIAINGGEYGGDGTEYRTENASFNRIVSYNGSVEGHIKFKVWTKGGLIKYYGYTSDSEIELAGSSTKTIYWQLNKIEDTKGNYIKYNYTEDNANGEFRLSSIEYTGNNDVSPALSPYARVEFIYENRTDKSFSYVAGTKSKLTKRLKTIKCLYQKENVTTKELVRQYDLQYVYKGENQKSCLSSVTESANDDAHYEPITFTWDDKVYGQGGTFTYDSYPREVTHNCNFFFGDFDGNGLQDFVTTPNKSFKGDPATWQGYTIFLAYDSGVGFRQTSASTTSFFHDDVYVGDFNGDGLSDIIKKVEYNTNSYRYWVKLARLSSNFGIKSVHFDGGDMLLATIPKSEQQSLLVGDYNGDGISDVFIRKYNSNTHEVAFGSFSKIFSFKEVELSISGELSVFGEFNGDGRTDLKDVHSEGSKYYTIENDGTANLLASRSWPKTDHIVTYGDFNGDGKTDWLGLGYKDFDWSNWVINFSTGNGFENVYFSRKKDIRDDIIKSGDFNGDGKSDIIILPGEKSDWDGVKLYLTNSNSDNLISSTISPSITSTKGQRVYIGDFSSDGSLDLFTVDDKPDDDGKFWKGVKLYARQRTVGNLMTSVTNSFGQTTTINYEPLTDNSVYTKYTNSTYPVSEFESPMFVVSSVDEENGVGGTSSTSYKYEGGKLHKTGKGFLGFSKLTTINDQTKIKSISYYELDETTLQLDLTKQETRNGNLNDVLLSQSLMDYETKTYNDGNHARYFRYVSSKSETTYKLSGQTPYKRETESYVYDDYGNATSITSIAYDMSGEPSQFGGYETDEINKAVTVNVYDNTIDANRWHLGRLTSATVTSNRSNYPAYVRNTTFKYNQNSGLLEEEVIEPGHELSTTKTYTHDGFGNILASTVTDGDKTLVNSSKYDERGRFEIESYNALNHKTINEYDEVTGALISTTDPNGFTTTHIYDDFGNLVHTTAYDKIETASTLAWYDAGLGLNGPTGTKYYSYSITSGSQPVYTYFDKYGRELRKESYGMDGTSIFRDIKYNALGQTEKQSDPYFKNTTPVYTTFEYDKLGRTTKATAPDGTSRSTNYDGLRVYLTNALGQQSLKIRNVLGDLTYSRDNNNKGVSYYYNSSGKLQKISDSQKNLTIIGYNKLGYKTSINDPDLGTTTYIYNAFGELTSSTDPNGNTKTIEYDELGRKTKVTEPEGVTTYTYDATTTTLGLLSTVSSTNGLSKTFYYDKYNRNYKVEEVVNGETFTSETTYDVFGRVKKVIYPSGYKVENCYNEYGFLTTVREVSTGKSLWHATAMNASGQLENFTLGSNISSINDYNPLTGRIEGISTSNATGSLQDYSYEYDGIGNLLKRSDNNKLLTEHFSYNEGSTNTNKLNRLTSYYIEGRENEEVTITYDELGNITYKSDVGNYHYDGAKPHAVTSIDNYAGSLADYEERITYTSFHKVKTITDPGRGKRMELTYGSGGERRISKIFENDVLTSKHFYLGHYEKVENQAGINEIHYIKANNQIFAIYEKKSNDKPELSYLLKDHLGSTAALVGEDGTLKKEFSYDAWGMRRNPQTWSKYNNPSEAEAGFYRGYTGHEHMDLFALVNMNGRVYDPEIGRFLSADPYVQMPDYTQSLNRYSYVLNNPLSLTDPTGYFSWKGFFKTLVPIVVGIGVGILTGGIGAAGTLMLWQAMLSGAAAGFAGAFSGALVNGASFGQALKAGLIGGAIGALSAGVSHGIGTAMKEGFDVAKFGFVGKELIRGSMHGVAQGGISELQGGKFSHGFFSGAFASVAGSTLEGMSLKGIKLKPFQELVVASAIGGTASSLGGGKFANGAISGAFVQMYNRNQHEAAVRNYVEKANINSKVVGYGFSYGGTASLFGGVGVKTYHIWDMYSGYGEFIVPFAAVGFDVSVELNGVLITGNDFHVSDFSGGGTAINLSAGFFGGSLTETSKFTVWELGGTLGMVPFTGTVTPGYAVQTPKFNWKTGLISKGHIQCKF